MDALPEVLELGDARGPRPDNAVGIGTFWHEPEVWTLSLSPKARVLYAGLCSYLGHREINRKDLRNTLKGSSDEEIAAALEDLAIHGLLESTGNPGRPGYRVRSVRSVGA